MRFWIGIFTPMVICGVMVLGEHHQHGGVVDGHHQHGGGVARHHQHDGGSVVDGHHRRGGGVAEGTQQHDNVDVTSNHYTKGNSLNHGHDINHHSHYDEKEDDDENEGEGEGLLSTSRDIKHRTRSSTNKVNHQDRSSPRSSVPRRYRKSHRRHRRRKRGGSRRRRQAGIRGAGGGGGGRRRRLYYEPPVRHRDRSLAGIAVGRSGTPPLCPPAVGAVTIRTCSIESCTTHAQCGQKRACCFNGCVNTCQAPLDNPAVIDWLEDTDARPPLLDKIDYPKLPERYMQNAAYAAAGEEAVTLPGGCIVSALQFKQLKDFMTAPSIDDCMCSGGEVVCAVKLFESSLASGFSY